MSSKKAFFTAWSLLLLIHSVSAQNRIHILDSLRKPPLFMQLGVGFTLTKPSSGIEGISSLTGYSGVIPLSIGKLIRDKHVVHATLFFEDYFPIFSYEYQPDDIYSVRVFDLNLSATNISLSYGRRYPFTFLQNNFHITPKIGVLTSIINDVKPGEGGTFTFMQEGSAGSDTLTVTKVSKREWNKVNLSLAVGMDLETQLFHPRLALVWQSSFNLTLTKSAATRLNLSFTDTEKNFSEEFTHRLNNFNTSIALRYYFQRF